MTHPAVTPRSPRTRTTPRDVLGVLFRQKRKTVAFSAIVLTATVSAAWVLPDVFRSEARMLVRLGRESVVMDPTASIGQAVQPIQTRESEINSEIEILRSRELAEAVVARLTPAGVVGRPADERAALMNFSRRLHVGVIPDSNVLSVSFDASDAARARDVVEAVVDEFLDLRLRVYRSPGSEVFFADQHRRATGELLDLQDQIRRIKDRQGLADLVTQRTHLLTRISELEKEQDQASSRLAAARATVADRTVRVAELPEKVVVSRTSGAPHSSVEIIRQELVRLRLEEQDLTSRYVETSPVVLNVRAKIAQAEGLMSSAEVEATETLGLNETRQVQILALEQARSAAAAESARLGRLAEDLRDARTGLVRLNDAAILLADLERRAAAAEENVVKYGRTYEEARIDQALQADKITNISVYQPAKLPLKPDGPNRLLVLVAGVFVAFGGGVCVAFAADTLDRSVRLPDNLSEVDGVAGVVSIPRLYPAARRHGSPRRLAEVRRTLRRLSGTLDTGSRVRSLASVPVRGTLGALDVAVVAGSAVWVPVAWGWNLTCEGFRRLLGPDVPPRLGVVAVAATVTPTVVTPFVWESGRATRASAPSRPEADVRRGRGFWRVLRLCVWAAWRDLRHRPTPGVDLAVALPPVRSSASEAIRRSTTQVLEALAAADTPPQVVAVVGARPGSGTSTLAAHLADVLGDNAGDDVLLLRVADGAWPADDESGPVLTRTVSGSRTEDVEAALASARRSHRRIVLDLPPVFGDDDDARYGEVHHKVGLRLSASADATVLVLEAGSIRREVAARAVELLTDTGHVMPLIVLNKREYPVPRWLWRRA